MKAAKQVTAAMQSEAVLVERSSLRCSSHAPWAILTSGKQPSKLGSTRSVLRLFRYCLPLRRPRRHRLGATAREARLYVDRRGCAKARHPRRAELAPLLFACAMGHLDVGKSSRASSALPEACCGYSVIACRCDGLIATDSVPPRGAARLYVDRRGCAKARHFRRAELAPLLFARAMDHHDVGKSSRAGSALPEACSG